MRVWVETLGYELAVAPVPLAGRTRVQLGDELSVEHLLTSGASHSNIADLRGLLLDLGVLEAPELSDTEVIHQVTQHICWGRVWLLELEQLSASIHHEPESERPVEVRTKDWIEIQLVDESGAPVPNVAYEITLPDGSRRRGQTNVKGVIRFNGIEPGVCDFTFSELDGAAWEPA